MIHRSRFARLAACLLGALLQFARPAAAAPQILPDSTVLDIWRLSNGLRVVVRHLSNVGHVAITLAWPVGSDADPAGLTGRGALLAELQLTAPAGDSPERTREELDLIRPAGWGSGVSPRVTEITEIATLPQFPGTLHQVAERLRGVTVNDSVIQHALATLGADLRRQRSPTGNVELYRATRALALGGYDPGDAAAGLRALAKLKPAEVQTLMKGEFAANGAVLSLAGNLGNINLRALIENEFGAIAGGTRNPEPRLAKFEARARDLSRSGLKSPQGAIGIFAPALDDSLHPSFYLNMLFLGGFCQKSWPKAEAPFTTRFQYSLFDDPDMARFFPPPGPGHAADSSLDDPFNEIVSKMGAMLFPPESFETMLRGVAWLLGDPLPDEILMRATRDPGVIATLANNQAVRELWGGEPFWSEYRSKLTPEHMKQFAQWSGYVLDPRNRVKILLRP